MTLTPGLPKTLQHTAVLAALLAFLLVTRLGALRIETIDWDENTFLLMAQSLLRGELLYEVAFDNKPPGLFYVLAWAMAWFGQSVLVVRWLTTVCVALTALIVFVIARRFSTNTSALLAAGILVAADSWAGGLAISSEIVAILPVLAALALLIVWPDRYWSSFLAGVAISTAVLVRTNLGFVAVGLGLVHLAALWMPQRLRLPRWSVFSYVLGGLVPLTPLLVQYAVFGKLDLLFVSAIEVPLSYSDRRDLFGGLAAMSRGLVRLMGLPTLAIGLLVVGGTVALLAQIGVTLSSIRQRVGTTRDLALTAAVAALVVLSIALGGVFYTHYLLQLFPFIALLATMLIGQRKRPRRAVNAIFLLGIAWAAVVHAPASWVTINNLRDLEAGYSAKQAAALIARDRQAEDEVWAANRHIVMFYLNQPPIIPLATHPSNLVRSSIIGPLARAGLVTAEPLREIVSASPRYIIDSVGGSSLTSVQPIQEFMADHYSLWQSVDRIAIWRRND